MRQPIALAVILFLVPAAVLAQSPGSVAARLTVHEVKTADFLKQFGQEDGAFVPTTFSREARQGLENYLEKHAPFETLEGGAAIGTPLNLKRLQTMAYTVGLDIEITPSSVEARPLRGTLQHGVMAGILPQRVDATGEMVCQFECMVAVPGKTTPFTLYGEPIDLIEMTAWTVRTMAAVPVGGAVIMGATVPGAPDDLYLMVFTFDGIAPAPEADAPAAAAESLTRRTFGADANLLATWRRKPGSGAIDAAEAKAVIDKGRTEMLSFLPIVRGEPFEDGALLQKTYVKAFETEEMGGRKAYDPLVATLRRGGVARAGKNADPSGPIQLNIQRLRLTEPMKTKVAADRKHRLPVPEILSVEFSENLPASKTGARYLFLPAGHKGRGIQPAVLITVQPRR